MRANTLERSFIATQTSIVGSGVQPQARRAPRETVMQHTRQTSRNTAPEAPRSCVSTRLTVGVRFTVWHSLAHDPPPLRWTRHLTLAQQQLRATLASFEPVRSRAASVDPIVVRLALCGATRSALTPIARRLHSMRRQGDPCKGSLAAGRSARPALAATRPLPAGTGRPEHPATGQPNVRRNEGSLPNPDDLY
jgi:hypothetical protein